QPNPAPGSASLVAGSSTALPPAWPPVRRAVSLSDPALEAVVLFPLELVLVRVDLGVHSDFHEFRGFPGHRSHLRWQSFKTRHEAPNGASGRSLVDERLQVKSLRRGFSRSTGPGWRPGYALTLRAGCGRLARRHHGDATREGGVDRRPARVPGHAA